MIIKQIIFFNNLNKFDLKINNYYENKNIKIYILK